MVLDLRFLSPGMAWALAAPAAIVILYLLRRRFLPRQVPSVFLWRKSLRDYAANRPFQKLMKNLLLPLQVLAALALALALMRPVLPGGAAGDTVLILDISGSMQAVSGGRTRLEEAKEQAVRLIREKPSEERISVIAAGDEARRLVRAADRETAEQAVAALECGRGGADISRALTLAEALGREDAETRGTEITIFSDSLRLSDLPQRFAAAGPAIVNVGTGAENRAVYSLTAEKGKAWARIANFGESCRVTAVCEADGVLCGAAEAEIPAGETAGASFDIPADAERVRVTLREADALAADNTAETAVKHTAALKAAVTEDSVFLETALRVRPDLTVLRTEAAALASTEADLYLLGSNPLILTGSLPEDGWDPEATAFGPFSWSGDEKTGNAAAEVADSPVTGGVTMKNVFFRAWKPVTGGQAAVLLDGEPVIAWDGKTAVLGFDLHDTNLPLKYDFPVLIQNILAQILPEETEQGEAGEAPMPLEESDSRNVAASSAARESRPRSEEGRDLAGILLGLFLLLLVAEMGVSRYVC